MIFFPVINELMYKQLEMHGYVLSTVDTDALVLKHQGPFSVSCSE